MTNETVNEDLIKKKVDTYYSKGVPVHITFKKGFWFNGYITEISSDFFMINEFLKGSMPVFFIEVYDINKFVREEKDG